MQRTTTKGKSRKILRLGSHRPPGQKASIKSRSATETKPAAVFRPHLLEHSLTEKSGYLFYKVDKEHRNPKKWTAFNDKADLAKAWIKCLRSHPNCKAPFMMPANGDIDDVLFILHNYTDHLFKGYNWSIVFPMDKSDGKVVTLYYFKSIGDVGNRNVPLDWFSKAEVPYLRSVGLATMKKLAKNFHIPMFTNDIFEIQIDLIKEQEEMEENDIPIVIERLKEQFWDGTIESWYSILKHAANYMSYIHGEPADLKKEMEEEVPTLTTNQFEFEVHQVSTHLPEVAAWLEEGRALADGPGFDIEGYNLLPNDFDHMDGDPVLIHHSLFFPYTFWDEAFEAYEGWLEDVCQSIGTNDIYEFGFLTAKNHVAPNPEHTKILKKLLKFLDKGQELYHKLKKQKNNGIN